MNRTHLVFGLILGSALCFMAIEAACEPELRGPGKPTFKSVKEWQRAGKPVPVHPISHDKNGKMKTGNGNAYGD